MHRVRRTKKKEGDTSISLCFTGLLHLPSRTAYNEPNSADRLGDVSNGLKADGARMGPMGLDSHPVPCGRESLCRTRKRAQSRVSETDSQRPPQSHWVRIPEGTSSPGAVPAPGLAGPTGQ